MFLKKENKRIQDKERLLNNMIKHQEEVKLREDTKFYMNVLRKEMSNLMYLAQVIRDNLMKETDEEIQKIGTQIMFSMMISLRRLAEQQGQNDTIPHGLLNAVVFHLSDATHNLPRYIHDHDNKGIIRDISGFFSLIISLEKHYESEIYDGLRFVMQLKNEYQYLFEGKV